MKDTLSHRVALNKGTECTETIKKWLNWIIYILIVFWSYSSSVDWRNRVRELSEFDRVREVFNWSSRKPSFSQISARSRIVFPSLYCWIEALVLEFLTCGIPNLFLMCGKFIHPSKLCLTTFAVNISDLKLKFYQMSTSCKYLQYVAQWALSDRQQQSVKHWRPYWTNKLVQLLPWIVLMTFMVFIL